MKAGQRKNTWLFAFTDLSFLLLIGLSLVPAASGDFSLRLAEMALPAVPQNRDLHPLGEQEEGWELRILPATGGKPFRLRSSQQEKQIDCDEGTLLSVLAGLRDRGIKPVLLPEKTSLSQDFLFAAGALAQVWSAAEYQAVVRPLSAGEKP